MNQHADKDEKTLSLPPEAHLEEAAQIIRLLGDKTRLAILALLAQQELSVGELIKLVNRPATGVSQHLAKLRIGRLVTMRRSGTTIYYSLANEHVGALVQNILDQTEHSLYLSPPHHEVSPL